MKKLSSFVTILLAVVFSFLPMQVHSSSEKSYHIKVYLHGQNVEVFRNGALIKKIPCSTGVHPGTTLSGKFKTYLRKEKEVWNESNGNEISAYYITRINDKNVFQSMMEGNHPKVEEEKKLFAERKPSSTGYICLRKEDAAWIYQLPLGVSVEVISDDNLRIKMYDDSKSVNHSLIKVNDKKEHNTKHNKEIINDKKLHANLEEDAASLTETEEYLPESLKRYLQEY